MFRTNADKLVRIAVEGKVAPPLVWPNEVGHDGRIHNIPALGGITYNVAVGDPAFGWVADHVEPGVSAILNPEKRTDKPNRTFNFLACIGNEAIVVSGKAKGKRGRVTGHHGGVEHVIIDFPGRVLESLSSDDRFQIRAFGQGLCLTDFPDVRISSLDPALMKKMKLAGKGGKLRVPVAAVVPGKLMGSGMGESNTFTGDFDIMTSEPAAIKRHGLGQLKFGDLVAVTDLDASFGWRYLEGAVIVGVVIHGDSHVAGHGPGITAIMTSPSGRIAPMLDPKANIGRILRIGRFRK